MGAAGWFSVCQLGWSVLLWVQLGGILLASSSGVPYCGSGGSVLLWVQLDGIQLASPGGVSYCGCSWVVFC